MKRSTAMLGIFLGISLVLGYVDSLIPLFPLPGFKIGLANIGVLFVLYRFSFKEAAMVSLLRVLLLSILFGNGVSAVYSLAGALCSLLMMAIVKKTAFFEMTGVSIIGAIAHHFGQIAAACLMVGSKAVFYYLPYLCVLSLFSGFLIAGLTDILLKRIV